MKTITNKSGNTYEVIATHEYKKIALLKHGKDYVVACGVQHTNNGIEWAQGYYFFKNPNDPFCSPLVGATRLFLEKCEP